MRIVFRDLDALDGLRVTEGCANDVFPSSISSSLESIAQRVPHLSKHADLFLGDPRKPPSTLDENADRFVGHEDNHVLWPLGCSEQMHMSIWRDGLPFLCFCSAFALLSLCFHSTPNGSAVHTDARVPGPCPMGSDCP